MRPVVRTKELPKIMQKALINPDSVIREEFLLFQSAVGYRQAVRLIGEV